MPEHIDLNLPGEPGEGNANRLSEYEPVEQAGLLYSRDEDSIAVLSALVEAVRNAHTLIDTHLEAFANASAAQAGPSEPLSPHARAVISAFQGVSDLMTKAGTALQGMKIYFGEDALAGGALRVPAPFGAPRYPLGTWVRYSGPDLPFTVLPLQVINSYDTSKGPYDYERHYDLEVQNTRSVIRGVSEGQIFSIAAPVPFAIAGPQETKALSPEGKPNE